MRSEFLATALALWTAFPALAATVEDYCSRPVRVALFEFGVLYRASTDDGIDPQLLDVIRSRTGCQFERVVLPRNRIWAELQNGSLDLATGAIPTPERKAYGYLLPYLKTRNLVLVRKDLAPGLKSIADLQGGSERVGIVRGFRHEPTYDALVAILEKQDRVVKAADIAENLKLLDKGIVGAIFSQPIVFRQYLSEDYLQNNVVLRDWAPNDEMSIGALILSRKSFTATQASNWDALLVALQKDGTLQKINRSFLSQSQARDVVYTGPRSPD
jgi:polar amino acid transport system substrate-binding protein